MQAVRAVRESRWLQEIRTLETKRQAQFHFWREIGKRMAIRQIPQTLAELERFNLEYEASRFRATEAGARLARSQQNVFLAWFPFVPNRLGARAISSMLDERVVRSLGLVRATGLERRASDRALRLRALALRPLPARRRPRLRTTMRRRSYPAGYTIVQLGPPPTA